MPPKFAHAEGVSTLIYYWRLSGKDVRPTMALEVESTNYASKTLGDAEFWLSRSHYQPIVLTVQVLPQEQKVVVTRWKQVDDSIQQCGQVSAQACGDSESLESRGESITIPVAALLGRTQADQDQRVLKIDRRHAEAILHNLRDHKESRAADKRAPSPRRREPPACSVCRQKGPNKRWRLCPAKLG